MANKNFTPITENYNINEEFLYSKTYLFIKGFAAGKNLTYTLKALPLARKVHDGQYRHGTVKVRTLEGNVVEKRLPYVLHVLKVASTLISLSLPLSDEELDLLICVGLLHDVIEDNDGFFKNGGRELVTEYGFPEEVYNTVKLLSKRHGATEEELDIYFNEIKLNKIALLVKMADRSHNVEDLYNMKLEKIHKYVDETRRWIYPLAAYAKQNYPELSNGVTILKSKIVSLTEASETVANIFTEELDKKNKEIEDLKRQLEELKK